MPSKPEEFKARKSKKRLDKSLFFGILLAIISFYIVYYTSGMSPQVPLKGYYYFESDFIHPGSPDLELQIYPFVKYDFSTNTGTINFKVVSNTSITAVSFYTLDTFLLDNSSCNFKIFNGSTNLDITNYYQNDKTNLNCLNNDIILSLDGQSLFDKNLSISFEPKSKIEPSGVFIFYFAGANFTHYDNSVNGYTIELVPGTKYQITEASDSSATPNLRPIQLFSNYDMKFQVLDYSKDIRLKLSSTDNSIAFSKDLFFALGILLLSFGLQIIYDKLWG